MITYVLASFTKECRFPLEQLRTKLQSTGYSMAVLIENSTTVMEAKRKKEEKKKEKKKRRKKEKRRSDHRKNGITIGCLAAIVRSLVRSIF